MRAETFDRSASHSSSRDAGGRLTIVRPLAGVLLGTLLVVTGASGANPPPASPALHQPPTKLSPIPDVTARIELDAAAAGRYHVRVTVVNQGGAPMPAVTMGVTGAAADGSVPFTSCMNAQVDGCVFGKISVPSLAAGQRQSYLVGGPQSKSLKVEARIQCTATAGQSCEESNTANNVVSRVIVPDLAVSNLGLNPLRYVSFSLENQGSPTGASFASEIYVNGALKETIQHPPMGAATSRSVEATQARLPDCKPGTVRVVVDRQGAVAEIIRGNNDASQQVTPGCPDVTAHISKDSMDGGLRYQAKITIENKGTGAMGPVSVTTLGSINDHIHQPPSLSQCLNPYTDRCVKDRSTVGPLGPGQKKSYHVGSKQPASNSMRLEVTISCGSGSGYPDPNCVESDTTNNVVRKTI